MSEFGSAAQRYAARVDAVIAQRTRVRGPQPEGDLFDGIPLDHPLMRANPDGPLSPNLQAIVAYVEPEDVIIDVGGGAGRYSLPLARRCRAVVNVDASVRMGEAFLANAAQAGLTNIRFVHATWTAPDAPVGTVALVNHATYLTREIVPFIEALERSGPRRVIITVNAPPPPARNRLIYALLSGEEEVIVPGHAELVDVLWELGILPDVRVLAQTGATAIVPQPGHEEAVAAAMRSFSGDQWALWPLGPSVLGRLHSVLEKNYGELFAETPAGVVPRWLLAEREILITWRPSEDRLVAAPALDTGYAGRGSGA
jgi:SAM-dependent methyltransferase